ncbi:hydantoinase/oxoprolinase family protein [Thauera sp.]|uniref:hydantoinase/oxoprolinase family protein n=1 Tax=Thauera sp. TaxID=1905334 RepID=UPI002CCE9E63|nr:hydantoinase/oxoprolinase family protein [Thauera sp.]HRP25877.1 hydantoinase/oxoprolinase family protein [Thauera sp.]
MHPAHTPETPAPDTAAASAREAAAVASSTPDAGARCAPLIGWDIGGAHVKASLLEGGTVTGIGQWATPLWKGLAHLDEALHAARARWPAFAHARHAVTMTAEMTDLFPDREAGVRALCAHLADRLGAATRFYAGEAGWLDAGAAAVQWPAVASANWLATASLVARTLPDALLIDIGSTTTDLIPIRAGRPVPCGRSDAARLASGELVYLGVVRSPLCALARRIRFRGQAYNVMNEFFSTTADVFRLTGELDPAHDLYPPADEGARDAAGSRLRLARMIGHDARDASADDWADFARRWRALMLAEIRRNLERVIRAADLPADAPLVGAGCGAFLVDELGEALGHPWLGFDRLAAVDGACADWARVCAPSVAVAWLAAQPAPAGLATRPTEAACSS